MANENQWCFAWVEKKGAAGSANRAALVKDAKWKSGDVITVSFLDGDPSVQDKVKAVAQEWVALNMARLSLVFRKETNTLIRISFKSAGSWSVIGTNCRQIMDQSRPTMNYGWLTPSSEEQEVRRVVLHEFGHALGLIHEHQNPGGKIDWNKENVSRDLSGPPNNWSADVIEHNMFEPYDKLETNFTSIDPKSIMMYPIPKKWTNNGFSVGLNSELSETDKKFIRQQYK